jgi:hypothetical protein
MQVTKADQRRIDLAVAEFKGMAKAQAPKPSKAKAPAKMRAPVVTTALDAAKTLLGKAFVLLGMREDGARKAKGDGVAVFAPEISNGRSKKRQFQPTLVYCQVRWPDGTQELAWLYNTTARDQFALNEAGMFAREGKTRFWAKLGPEILDWQE